MAKRHKTPSVKALDIVKADMWREYERTSAKRGMGGWRAVGRKFGVSAAMAHLIAVSSHEPRDPVIRERLGFPRLVLAPACKHCGQAHKPIKCPQLKAARKRVQRRDWKRFSLTMVGLRVANK